MNSKTIPILAVALLCGSALADKAADRTAEMVERAVKSVRYSEADADLGTETGQKIHMDRFKSAESSAAHLEMILVKKPRYWAKARKQLQDLPRDPARRDAKRRQLRLLTLDKDESTRNLLARELKADPKAFTADLVVRVDALGVEGARESLHRLMSGDPDQSKVRAAIHLGLRRDKSAMKMLTWAARQPILNKYFNSNRYGIAIGLKRLGVAGNWKAVREAAIGQIRTYLGRDDLKSARWYLSQFEYYVELADSDKTPHVTMLDGRAASYAINRMRELESKNAIAAALEKLSA